MNEKIFTGVLSGFLAAFAVDVNAFARSTDMNFDWRLALKRWVAGAITGAITALGISGAT